MDLDPPPLGPPNSRLEQPQAAAAERHPYVYCPLETSKSIRVFDIDPAERLDEPICGRIRTTSLNDPCRYQTMSYAWGPTYADQSHLTHLIICNGCEMRVTASLHAGLCRIRARLKPHDIFWPTLWADAICIDQTNEDERGHQVGVMADIFTKAKRLIIWLGEASHIDCARAFPLITKRKSAKSRQPQFMSEEYAHGEWNVNLTRPSDHPAVFPIHHHSEEQGTRDALSHGMNEDKTLLELFLNLSWFRRVWAVQEVLLSTPGARHVLFGHHRIRFEMFLLCIKSRLTDDTGSPMRVSSPLMRVMAEAKETDGLYYYGTMRRLKCFDRSQWYEPLCDIMLNAHFYQRAECTDPRDRIYALLGLSQPSSCITADYTMSVRQVYEAVARKYVKNNSFAKVLANSCFRNSDDHQKKCEWPSWVPDWRIPVTFESKVEHDVFDFLQHSSQNGKYKQMISPESVAIEANGDLVVSAWLVGSGIPAQLNGTKLLQTLQMRPKGDDDREEVLVYAMGRALAAFGLRRVIQGQPNPRGEHGWCANLTEQDNEIPSYRLQRFIDADLCVDDLGHLSDKEFEFRLGCYCQEIHGLSRSIRLV